MLNIYTSSVLVQPDLELVEQARDYYGISDFFKIYSKKIKVNFITFYKFDGSDTEYVCIKFTDGLFKGWFRKSSDKKLFFKDEENKNVEIFCIRRSEYTKLNYDHNPEHSEHFQAVFYKDSHADSKVFFCFKFFPYPAGGGNSGGVKIPNN